MLRTLLIFAAFGVLEAQQVVAPTPDQVGSPRGENTGNYNVTNSFETGYRFSQVGGDIGMYRSDVNYGNGLRLLGSSLTVNSKDGHGKYFDEIVLNTLGLGNDPYQAVTLRVQKNNLYRYDMTWRLDDYFNPGLTISGGLHQMDTSRTSAGSRPDYFSAIGSKFQCGIQPQYADRSRARVDSTVRRPRLGVSLFYGRAAPVERVSRGDDGSLCRLHVDAAAHLGVFQRRYEFVAERAWKRPIRLSIPPP